MEKYFSIMERCPLFAGISAGELTSLMKCLQARVQEIAKGDPVFLEGDGAGFVGLVLEGDVQVVRDDYDGSRTVLSISRPGELFAEAYACSRIPQMPVSGYAIRDSRILRMDCRKMLTVCTNACGFHNQLVKNLLQVVAEKNIRLSQKIQVMSQKTTRDKLMAYLLDQAKNANSPEFTIPLDRQGLADYLGVERSAMSAQLSKLREDGILESVGSRFRLK